MVTHFALFPAFLSGRASAARSMALYALLRLAVGLCFIGHGAFGLITKQEWLPYFGLMGIGDALAYRLMPVIGMVDILIGIAVLAHPLRGVLAYAAIWSLWTAALRPLAGEGVWEMLERAGNYGVPFALLLLGGATHRAWPTPTTTDAAHGNTSSLRQVALALQWTTALLLAGHGALLIAAKPAFVAHWAVLGVPAGALPVVGTFELLLALASIGRPAVGLFAFIACWKIGTESLWLATGSPVWEWIERAGSYAAPAGAALLLSRGATHGPARRSGSGGNRRGAAVRAAMSPVAAAQSRQQPAAPGRTAGAHTVALVVALVVALAAIFAPVVAHAQLPPPDAKLVDELRRGGMVLLCRHALTDHSQQDANVNFDDPRTQRRLSAAGEAQARELGRTLTELGVPIADVYASPYQRNMLSAELSFGSATAEPALLTRGDERRRRALLSGPIPSGGNRAIVTHERTIHADLPALVRGTIGEGACVVVRPDGAGGYRAIAQAMPADWRRLLTKALTLDDALGILEFTQDTQITMSPDGDVVAFTLKDPRRDAARVTRSRYFDERGAPRQNRATDVYLAYVATGATRRLTGGSGSAWGPVWSPDGGQLAFYSDADGFARIWIWDRAQDTITPLSHEIVRPWWGFEQMHWSADGRRLLVKLLPEATSFAELDELMPDPASADTPAVDGAGVTARTYAHMPVRDVHQSAAGGSQPAATQPAPDPPIDIDATRSFLNVQLGDIAVVDVPTGRAQRIAQRVRAIGYRFAPDGDRVAFTTRQPDGGTGMLVYDRYDLWVVGLDGAPATLIAPRTVQEFGLSFSWSPDGAALAYSSAGIVHVVRAADGAPVGTFERHGVELQHDYRPPLWLDERTLVIAARDTLWKLSLATSAVTPAAMPLERRLVDIVAPADAQRIETSHVMVTVADARTKRRGFQRLDIETGTATRLHEDDVTLGSSSHLSLSRDSRMLAFVSGNAARPPDIWTADVAFEHVRRLTDLHPTVAGLGLGGSRMVEWTDSAGRRLQGALLLPAGYEPGTRYPLVVEVYGGSSRSGLVNRFGVYSGMYNLHLLASRGYAVLLPDAPLRVGSPMTDLAATVLPGIDAVVDLGIADPERIAVMGHSFGGYSALALAVQSSRFRAVISSAGFSNLLTQYTAMREDGSVVGINWAERDQGRMGGHPWEHFERYHANSPFFFLDRITAPVLLLQGGADHTVTPRASQETFVALRRLDREVMLVQYEGEDHDPGQWTQENATDYWDRIIGWLDRHLGRE